MTRAAISLRSPGAITVIAASTPRQQLTANTRVTTAVTERPRTVAIW